MAARYEPWRARAEHEPARVAVEFNHLYRVYGLDGDLEAVVSGRLKHHATSRSELPAVGDWVVVRRRADEGRASIVHVLPRRSCFSRKAAGGVTDEQVVAANVDVVFLVMALDGDFSPRRLERYLLLARDSGAVIGRPAHQAGSRAPTCPRAVAEVAAVSGPVPVHVLNPRTGDGVDAIRTYVTHGRTCALLGSSGVGKSTIVNGLVGADGAAHARRARGRLERPPHHHRTASSCRCRVAGCCSTRRACASCSSGTSATRWSRPSRTSSGTPRPAASPTAVIATSRGAG